MTEGKLLDSFGVPDRTAEQNAYVIMEAREQLWHQFSDPAFWVQGSDSGLSGLYPLNHPVSPEFLNF